MERVDIDRSFVRLDEGLVHLRSVAGPPGATPVLLLHSLPASARALEPLMRALAARGLGPVLAPDTPGSGDSAPPAADSPDMACFAGAAARLLDRLGHPRAHVYGTHTGARIACELAAAHPDRVASVVFDGIADYEPAMRALLLERYAPSVEPDDYGRQFAWAFGFVRDIQIHFPHFLRDPEHRLTSRAMPPADELHALALDVLKSLTSYHKPYRAAFAYVARERLPAVRAPALFLTSATELANLQAASHALAALVPGARTAAVAPTPDARADAIAAHVAGR